ncbi:MULTISPECIES: YHS domain-containing protein [Haloarculaceae]|jgi:Cu+-exporting ATPase|uniref:YHS domain-containing protein n=1 Tax=Haloarcula rubra TaxID=2487747 RepID=A0AAW4PWB8_9EURY|nr:MULTISPECIES: YHS domain-containing protein [Haloarculaceae]MBX0324939.1 YHS domain-containing protein [Halomicroarcula rubra]
MTTDPVCGMELLSGEAAATVQYGGKTYYFCSDECRQQFQVQPAVYTE